MKSTLPRATPLAVLAALAWSGAALAAAPPPAAAPAAAPAPQPAVVVIDRVVASIGDEAITLHEVEERAAAAKNPVAEVIAGGGGSPDATVTLQSALDDLIAERLILAEGKKLDLTVSEADIDKNIKGIMEQNNWADTDFEGAVKMLGFPDTKAYRDHARRELLKSQVLRLKVGARVRFSDREVDEEFKRQYADDTEEEVHLWHIAFLIPDQVDVASLRGILAKAEEVRRLVAAGNRSFEDLAREYGQDGAAPRGGDVGWFPRGRLQGGLEETAFGLKEGVISPVVQSSVGFHILRVTERRRVPLKDAEEAKRRVRYDLSEKAFEKLYRQYVLDLRSSGRVVVKGLNGPSQGR